MSDALRSLTAAAVLAIALPLSGCGGDSAATDRPENITTAWKKYFTAADRPSDWRSLGKATERVLLDDGYLSIDGEIADCEDARVYWQMGLEWKKEKDTGVSQFITVNSDGNLAGDTATTGEFDCHL